MAGFDEENIFAKPRPLGPHHEIGESLDMLSAPELDERIQLLREEIVRLEAAIQEVAFAREASHFGAAGSIPLVSNRSAGHNPRRSRCVVYDALTIINYEGD
jgi:uncharacterized small protein (DUF1192 family)